MAKTNARVYENLSCLAITTESSDAAMPTKVPIYNNAYSVPGIDRCSGQSKLE